MSEVLFDLPVAYQATAFVDLSGLVVDKDLLRQLLDLYESDGLLPSVSSGTRTGKPDAKPPLLNLTNQSQSWVVAIYPHRIDVHRQQDTLEEILEPASDFANRAVMQIQRFLEIKPSPASRLSLVLTGFSEVLSDVGLASLYRSFFNPFSYVDGNQPDSWEGVLVLKKPILVNAREEVTNFHFSFKTILVKTRPLDQDYEDTEAQKRIQVSLDINTLSEHTTARIPSKSFKSFYDSVLPLADVYLKEIKERIHAMLR